MAEIQHFLPQQPSHLQELVTDQPAVAWALLSLGCPSPLRREPRSFGPVWEVLPLEWASLSTRSLCRGTRRRRLHMQQPLPEALLLHCQPAALGYPGIGCMASRRALLAGDHSPSLCLQCKSKLCKPQLPAHVCPSSHPHLHGCTATAGRRGQRTSHSAAYRSPEAMHSPPLPARALVFTVGDIPDWTRCYPCPGIAFKASCCVFSKAL